jgi:hypothetical protein
MRNKKKKIILAIGIIFVVALLVIIAGRNGKNSDSDSLTLSASLLTSTERFFDFGEILMGDGNVVHQFKVKNNGAEPVLIEKVYTSCMCTTARLSDEDGKKLGLFGMQGHGLPSGTKIKVLPGEVILVDAVFDPAAHGPSGVGRTDRTIYLETNSRETPMVELDFTALVKR